MKTAQHIINKTELTNKEVKFIALNVQDILDSGLSVYDSKFDLDMPSKIVNLIHKLSAKLSLNMTYLYRVIYYYYFNKKAI